MDKCKSITDHLDKNELSVIQIAGITGHSINKVRRIKLQKEA